MVCDNLQNTSIAANGTLAHYLQPQSQSQSPQKKKKREILLFSGICLPDKSIFWFAFPPHWGPEKSLGPP